MNSKKINSDRICAGIVTYNPDMERLKENISAIINQVEKIIIIDNHSNNISEIQEYIKVYSAIVCIKNSDNLGIAAALNQIVLWSKQQDFSWVLTLDQDSVCQPGLIEAYKKHLYLNKVGMFTCDIVDRNYIINKKTGNMQDYEQVSKCITSGCLTNILACIESGMFDEKLFIDSVDYDMCYSMQEHNYSIVLVHMKGLLHEVGKSRKYNILGFEFAVNNHSSLRKYYISRNSIYTTRKHHLNKWKEDFIVYKRIFTVLFFEENKIEKIGAILKGIKDGKKMFK